MFFVKRHTRIISANARNDMFIAWEYSFSSTITDSHEAKRKEKGAPVGWIPMESVVSNL